MAISPFRRVRSDDNLIRQLQDAVGLVFQSIVSREILDGTLIKGVVIPTGTAMDVSHKLGRPYVGYIVTTRNANSTVWDSPSLAPSSLLTLNSSADVTVDLWIF